MTTELSALEACAKGFDNRKHAVEHVVVESNRLSEMVWNMDVQIGEFNEGTKQAAESRRDAASDRTGLERDHALLE